MKKSMLIFGGVAVIILVGLIGFSSIKANAVDENRANGAYVPAAAIVDLNQSQDRTDSQGNMMNSKSMQGMMNSKSMQGMMKSESMQDMMNSKSMQDMMNSPGMAEACQAGVDSQTTGTSETPGEEL